MMIIKILEEELTEEELTYIRPEWFNEIFEAIDSPLKDWASGKGNLDGLKRIWTVECNCE
ncbi:hypothetical protein SDC9_196542 [bioreactor metagenome]|uniref:Uncharacterized protein n=1 Tax=bioreactor metagenome TaxID=1076179 RepID=A0A645IEP6_9ZZZZ